MQPDPNDAPGVSAVVEAMAKAIFYDRYPDGDRNEVAYRLKRRDMEGHSQAALTAFRAHLLTHPQDVAAVVPEGFVLLAREVADDLAHYGRKGKVATSDLIEALDAALAAPHGTGGGQ